VVELPSKGIHYQNKKKSLRVAYLTAADENILSSPNTSALIIELNGSSEEFGYSNKDIHNKLISLKFQPVAYEPISRSLIKLNDFNKNGGNTIYVKNIELILERCRVAPKRCVHTAGNIFI
jgi:hypothetical protein